MITKDRQSMKDQWQIKREKGRIRYLLTSGLREEDLGRNGVETDGGNIFYKNGRVAVFSDEETHGIELLYTTYGIKPNNILCDELKIVLEFRKILDKRHIPYTESPSRKDMAVVMFREIGKLEELARDIK